ncbi:hypothetical protein AB0C18_32155 [Nonomuraea muscovyensis]|uniref:hypothetical protein n=1 Tax=Nonomuraea muscovyensis TaxID=1124761 RepID=UPI0033C9DDF4
MIVERGTWVPVEVRSRSPAWLAGGAASLKSYEPSDTHSPAFLVWSTFTWVLPPPWVTWHGASVAVAPDG